MSWLKEKICPVKIQFQSQPRIKCHLKDSSNWSTSEKDDKRFLTIRRDREENGTETIKTTFTTAVLSITRTLIAIGQKLVQNDCTIFNWKTQFAYSKLLHSDWTCFFETLTIKFDVHWKHWKFKSLRLIQVFTETVLTREKKISRKNNLVSWMRL